MRRRRQDRGADAEAAHDRHEPLRVEPAEDHHRRPGPQAEQHVVDAGVQRERDRHQVRRRRAGRLARRTAERSEHAVEQLEVLGVTVPDRLRRARGPRGPRDECGPVWCVDRGGAGRRDGSRGRRGTSRRAASMSWVTLGLGRPRRSAAPSPRRPARPRTSRPRTPHRSGRPIATVSPRHTPAVGELARRAFGDRGIDLGAGHLARRGSASSRSSARAGWSSSSATEVHGSRARHRVPWRRRGTGRARGGGRAPSRRGRSC